MHTSNTFSDYEIIARVYGLGEGDVIFMASPFGHQLGFALGLRLPIFLGAKAVYQDLWDPAAAVELMAREGVTFTCTTPTFLMDFLRAPNLAQHHYLPSLRVWMLGGAPFPPTLRQEAQAKLPHVFFAPSFGMTEVGDVILTPPGAPADKALADGCPQAGVEIKVLDRQGRELPPDTDGELAIKSPTLFVGYYKRPDLTADSFTPDGFFKTGDQVRMDRDGYIRVTGRIKDMIIRGGENIAPAEIEDILLKHPKVAEAAVVGMPDARLGERVCAYVVPRPGEKLTLAEVVDFVAEAGVAKQKWPERLELIDALPKTPAGKVQKYVLRAMIAEKLAAEGRR